jgi:hypothetical protein
MRAIARSARAFAFDSLAHGLDSIVMVALVATIHDFLFSAEANRGKKDVDGRPRADHDDLV